MIQELDTIKLSQLAEKAYGDFSYICKVLREANVDVKEAKNLINKALDAANVAEEIFDKIEDAVQGQKGDDVLMLRQSINERRKFIDDFKKSNGIDNEPNA